MAKRGRPPKQKPELPPGVLVKETRHDLYISVPDEEGETWELRLHKPRKDRKEGGKPGRKAQLSKPVIAYVSIEKYLNQGMKLNEAAEAAAVELDPLDTNDLPGRLLRRRRQYLDRMKLDTSLIPVD